MSHMIIIDDVATVELGTEYDAAFCDPPYGLKFMGKDWDHGVPNADVWRRVLDALKPGAYLLAFGGTRTWHRLAVAIEDAGFEIRDTIMWLHGMGFPKSHNVGAAINAEQWQGYGTALKPAWEPIIVARKPMDGTVAQNVLAHGCGGLNIDGCRIPLAGESTERKPTASHGWKRGRWPTNLILDEIAAGELDDQSGHSMSRGGTSIHGGSRRLDIFKMRACETMVPLDSGGASRFFYCAKARNKERDAGIQTEGQQRDVSRNAHQPSMNDGDGNPYNRGAEPVPNFHPTIKPVALTEYLARLILPPGRDTPRKILVPFCGSGSEMIGCLLAG